VRGDPVELQVDHAQRLRARRDLDVEQALDGHAEDGRVRVVREVVHPLDERDHLPVLLVLARLLDARVDVADDRHHVHDHLAPERGQEAQDAVGGRVVRPDVEGEDLLVGVDLRPVQPGVDLAALVADPLDRERALAVAVGDGPGVADVSHTSAGADARCR
jgi:hypothetical protein